MPHYLIFSIFSALLVVCALRVRAQDGVYVRIEGDTLRYTYTPLTEEEAARYVLPAELDAASAEPAAAGEAQPEKKNFLRRFVEYFEKANTDRTFEKKIDFTFAGGPSYSKNTSLGLGILAAGLYRIDRTDSVTQPSNVSIFASASISGFYALGVSGYTIWNHNRQRVNYTAMFSSAPYDLWGIGYDAGRNNPKTTYVRKLYRVEGVYLHQLLPGTYLGGRIDFRYTRGKDFKPEAEAYLNGQRADYTATGLGLVAEYDTRDVISAPMRGAYVSLQATWYPEPLGSCGKSLWRTTLTADWYHPLWNGGTVATDLYAEFNTNGTPWPLLAQLGGSYRMRGYYEGQYMDNDLVTFQVELRQRIWRRIGCTVWAGAGNVFPEMARFDWSQTLPNYGIGLRWELKRRVNVRFDYGFGKNTSGFLLNINEAF